MVEVNGIKITVKDNLVYFNTQGVDYVTEINKFFADLQVFIFTSGNCKQFDLYMLERIEQQQQRRF